MTLRGDSVVMAVWGVALFGLLALASQAGWTDWDDPHEPWRAPGATRFQLSDVEPFEVEEVPVVVEEPWVQVSALWECRDMRSDLHCRPIYELENLGVVPLPPPPKTLFNADRKKGASK